MRKILFMMVVAAATLTSCSKLGPLSADLFTVTPTPLETQAGQVPATIAGSFPEKYMAKKGVVTVTPELRYGNGQTVQGESATFQGEKVAGNDQTISYKLGGRYTMKASFAYVPEMQKSELWLTFKANIGKKVYDVPAVKVDYGVIATSELYKQTVLADGGVHAQDAYQRVSQEKQESNIKFLVNQAKIRKSELKGNSVAEFVQMLKKINADREGLNLQNVEIQAYASPEGGFDFNNKLSEKRQNTTEDYVKSTLKNNNLADANIDAHYTAQDWEGFKQLVSVSNIQDKDVIIRVLEMYKDPEERERQIRNMGAGFTELKAGILPELRRSRMIINYELIGRSDEQIMQQFKADATKLSVEEMLYAATLTKDNAEKTAIYKKTTEVYPNDYRAYNNLASMAMISGDTSAAKNYLNQSLKVNGNQCEALANRGLLELCDGNLSQAEADIAKASTFGNASYAQGVLDVAKGNYSAAQSELKGTATNSEALAQLLNKNYTDAAKTLDGAEYKGATNSYLHAVNAARRENKAAAASYLKEALKQNPALKSYADNDLELNITRE